jgi:hypothetical protein
VGQDAASERHHCRNTNVSANGLVHRTQFTRTTSVDGNEREKLNAFVLRFEDNLSLTHWINSGFTPHPLKRQDGRKINNNELSSAGNYRTGHSR